MSNLQNDFSFSSEAQNIKALFYNKKVMVYVEGDDDIPFWNYYFPSDICQIECVGGCENLTEKIDNIERGLLKCIVACDADYSFYHDDVQEHKLVVRTESHSIECVLYCPYKLNDLLQKHSRRIVDFTPSIISKYQQFETDIEELVLYDITNDVYKKGTQILGNSCQRFLYNEKSACVDLDKIRNFLSEKREYFAPEELQTIKNKMNQDSRCMREIAKGHFQTSFVINLIKEEAYAVNRNKKTNLSEDYLYSTLVHCPDSCSFFESCERNKIKEKCSAALDYLHINAS